MKIITLQAPGQFATGEAVAPTDIAPGHALIRIRRVGICGTDLHAYQGNQPFFTYPRILGHELGVEVVEVNDPSGRLKAGMRCSVEPYLNCGTCQACRRGKSNCCERLEVLGVHTDGGMREYITVPVQKLHPSDQLSFEQLALVETLAIGAQAVRRAQVTAEDNVLLIGAGPIGLSVLQFVQLTGASVLVTDRQSSRLAFCQQLFPGTETIPADDDLADSLRSHLDGDLPTVVFDATGNAASMMKAFDYVAHGGKLVYVGLFQGEVHFFDPLFHRKEITLLASRNAVPEIFTSIIEAMEKGRIDTTPWITHRATLEMMPEQFPSWLDPANRVLKAMVTI